jgi:hypothetical protein
MIGTIIYIFLDVSFNVVIWTGKKTINGVCNAVNYTTNAIHNYKINKNENTILPLDPPAYEDINIYREIKEENKLIEEEFLMKKKLREDEILRLIEKQEDSFNKLKKILNNID